MNREELTKMLSSALEYHLNPHKDPRIYVSKEITFDYATSTSIRVDYMRFKPINMSASGIEKGDFYCYEIKSRKDDFKSKNGHNFIGDFNYYVIPSELYNEIKNEIAWDIGVYTYNKDIIFQDKLINVRKAKRRNRSRALNEMILMMYRSNQRDLIKKEKEEKKHVNAKNEIENMNQFKRPILEEDKSGFGDKTLACPNCHKSIINVWSQKKYKPNYCHYCGQGFRWEERE